MMIAGYVQNMFEMSHGKVAYHWRMFPRLFNEHSDIITEQHFCHGDDTRHGLVTIYSCNRCGDVLLDGKPIATVRAVTNTEAIRVLGYVPKWSYTKCLVIG